MDGSILSKQARMVGMKCLLPDTYCFHIIIHMNSIASSITLVPDIDRRLREIAKATGQSRNAIIQQALRDYFRGSLIAEIELKMQARARALGIESDEDVVALVREVRGAKSRKRRASKSRS